MNWSDKKEVTSFLVTGSNIVKHNAKSIGKTVGSTNTFDVYVSKDNPEIQKLVVHKNSLVEIVHDEHKKLVVDTRNGNEKILYKNNQMEFDPFFNTMSYVFD